MAIQGGVTAVVASSGTALTQPQAQLLRRFAARVVLSFDPDAAGQGAAVRSCDLLVREGFDVNVALLPAGRDPDLVVREEGGEAYQAIVDHAAAVSRLPRRSRACRSTTRRRRPDASRS